LETFQAGNCEMINKVYTQLHVVSVLAIEKDTIVTNSTFLE